jgi:hypothetical protein
MLPENVPKEDPSSGMSDYNKMSEIEEIDYKYSNQSNFCTLLDENVQEIKNYLLMLLGVYMQQEKCGKW